MLGEKTCGPVLSPGGALCILSADGRHRSKKPHVLCSLAFVRLEHGIERGSRPKHPLLVATSKEPRLPLYPAGNRRSLQTWPRREIVKVMLLVPFPSGPERVLHSTFAMPRRGHRDLRKQYARMGSCMDFEQGLVTKPGIGMQH